jgi:hypothetical protein
MWVGDGATVPATRGPLDPARWSSSGGRLHAGADLQVIHETNGLQSGSQVCWFGSLHSLTRPSG